MIRALLIAGAVCIAACSPPANTGQGKSGSPTSIQPGQYRTTVTIVSMTAPGLTQAQLQEMQSQPQSDENCITTTDISDLTRQSLVDTEDGETCSENRLTAANGRIEGAATCQDAAGLARTMQLSGSYTSTHVDMDVNVSGQTGMGPVTQHIRMTTDRIGECPAGSTADD